MRSSEHREWGEVAVVGGLWMLLIGSGLGNTTLVFLGAIAFGAALSCASGAGRGSSPSGLRPRGGRDHDLPLPLYKVGAEPHDQRGRPVDLEVSCWP
jgi:hypothetical protein